MCNYSWNDKDETIQTIDGITKTISEWAREYNISPDVIKDRINKLHWSEKEAVTTPKLRVGGKRWLKY